MINKPTEIKAIIGLLDDPDDDIFTQIKSKLLEIGPEAIPTLEAAWEDSFDGVFQTRVENIIHEIQFENIKKDIVNWSLLEHENLLKGLLLVAKYQYPDVNENKIKAQLGQIKKDIWLEFHEDMTALEKVQIINHILFEVHGFSGNTTNYHAPQNSYINNVLETKKGNPITLSVLYLLMCNDLNIPIYGINLPDHFVVGYLNDSELLEMQIPGDEHGDNILFYINPFSKGYIFQHKDIDVFLKNINVDPKKEFYEPCTNVDIIKRILRNLITAYQKNGYQNKVDEVMALYNSLD
jgi:regulator of sirC expression with transglutaminase-like and TPR domain